jgi:hypothetical protein
VKTNDYNPRIRSRAEVDAILSRDLGLPETASRAEIQDAIYAEALEAWLAAEALRDSTEGQAERATDHEATADAMKPLWQNVAAGSA